MIARMNRRANGSEFISRPLAPWPYQCGVNFEFTRHEKATDDALIETFNRKLRS